jgi:hypothetical protein
MASTLLATCFHAGIVLGFSALKVEAVYSSEFTLEFQQTTRHYIPGYSTLQGNVAHIPVQWYQLGC